MKIISILCLLISFAFASDTIRVVNDSLPVVGVVDFTGESQATVVSNALTAELVNADQFKIISRSDMQAIIMEQQFQMSGMVDTETGVELGKLIGAEYIITGDVSKAGINYYLTVKMINVETGEIVDAESARGMSINTLASTGVKKVSEGLLETE